MTANRVSRWVILLVACCVFIGSCGNGDQQLPPTPPPTSTPPITVPDTAEPTESLRLPEIPTATEASSPPTLPPPVIDHEQTIPLLAAGSSIEITEIHMVDSSRGWAISQADDVSDHILLTDDGGERWWDVTPPQELPADDTYLRATVFVLDRDNAWVSYPLYEIIWRTTDAGITWLPARTSLAGNLGADMFFVDETNGWIMKYLDAGMSKVYSALFRSTSGGAYWDKTFDPYGSGGLHTGSKTGMVFADAEYGWVTRDSGGVMPGAFVDVTYDGGYSWQEVPLPPPQDEPDKFDNEYCAMYSPHLFSKDAGALVVRCKRYDDGDQVLTNFVFSTADGGQTWSRYDYPGGELLFVNDNVAFALDSEIHQSRNAGRTWTKVKSVNWTGQFSFVNENLAWAVARAGDEIALVKTTNGCSSFSEIKPEVIAPPGAYQNARSSSGPGSLDHLSGEIGIISHRDESDSSISDIYLLDLETEVLTKITDSPGRIQHFSWSPDGQMLVFDLRIDDDYEIYTIKVDGTQQIQLTDNTIYDGDPDWSPDGTQIVYSSVENDERMICLMNIDGSGRNCLTQGDTPAWSPDGSKIAFSRTFDGIYTMDPTGANLTRITNSEENGWDYYPVWSPDGTQIIFGSNRHQPGDAATESVYIMNADGTGIGRLSQSWGMAPYAWSPDGLSIVYTSDFFSSATLHIMDVYGMQQRPLVADNVGRHPLWRP